MITDRWLAGNNKLYGHCQLMFTSALIVGRPRSCGHVLAGSGTILFALDLSIYGFLYILDIYLLKLH